MGQNKYTERWVRIKTQKGRSEVRYKEADQNYDRGRSEIKTQTGRSEIRHREIGQK